MCSDIDISMLHKIVHAKYFGLQQIYDINNFGHMKCPKILTSAMFGV